MAEQWAGPCDLYPRPPRGGRHTLAMSDTLALSFLPTPSARRATSGRTDDSLHLAISTHALREEGDLGQAVQLLFQLRISTHALREEGDQIVAELNHKDNISTHALREEGDPFQLALPIPLLISTHALREEGDRRRGWTY